MHRKSLSETMIDALLDFHRKQTAGVLRVESGANKKQIVIRAGTLAFAESNQPEEHLARILVSQRVIQRPDLPKISAAMKAGKASDQAIMAACRVSAAEIAAGAQEQARAILSSLLSWSDGELHVYTGEGFPDRTMDLRLGLPEFVLAAVRQAVADGKLPESIKSLQGSIRPAESSRATRSEIPLDSAECYACSLVTGPTRIETVLPGLASATQKPRQVLQCLLLLGFLAPEETKAGEPAVAENISQKNDFPEEEFEEMLRQFEVASHYEILGLPTDAGQDQIKNSYHALARRFHPDRFQSPGLIPFQAKAEKLFTFITGAYAVLSDPAARVSYDYVRTKQESPVEAAKNSSGPDKAKMAEMIFKAARMNLAKQEYDKAIGQFRECVWLDPADPQYHYFLGIAQAEVPRYRKEAEKNLLRAIELNNSYVASRLALGRLYIRANLARRAQLQFEEVLRWDPNNPEALSMLQGEAVFSR
jgi:tetratricopeptide (TPR) repeat protein